MAVFRSPYYTRRGRFPASLAVALFLIVLLGQGCSASRFGRQPTETPTATQTQTPTRTATPTASATATATATATVTASPTPTASATGTPTATATLTPTQVAASTASGVVIKPNSDPQPGSVWPVPEAGIAQDHYWLGRPTAAGTVQWANAFYPYGSDGQGSYLLHHGADIANPLGTPLLAPAAGTVVFAGSDDETAAGPTTNFYGNLVIIELDQRTRGDKPVFVLLGHMHKVQVETGQHVERGQPVGLTGMSGIALGPHVHVEVRIGQNDYRHTRNPEFWLEPLPGHGTLAGRLLTKDGRAWPNIPILFYPGPNFTSPRYYVNTYIDAPGLINPDDEWGENFLLSDLPANTYLIEIELAGATFREKVVVEAGKTSWIELRTP